jgi:hypothetical protein
MDHFRLDEQGLLAVGSRLKAADELRATPPPGADDLPSAELAVAFERFQEACAHTSRTLGEMKHSLGELADHIVATIDEFDRRIAWDVGFRRYMPTQTPNQDHSDGR